jgi:hypothetical protein
MTTKAGVGTSHHHNPNVAGREAAEQALKEAGVAKSDFVTGGPGGYRKGIPLRLLGGGYDKRR